VWCRINTATGTAAHMSWNYRVHERTARELETLFGHRPIQSSTARRKRGGRRASQDYEARQSERSGIRSAIISNELSALWEGSRTGSEFKRRLEEAGYVLVRGDRRVYVVIDRAGNAHSLARRLNGTDTQAVRQKLRDIALNDLPSVPEGRSRVRARSTLRTMPARFGAASREIARPLLSNNASPRATSARAKRNIQAMLKLDGDGTTFTRRPKPLMISRRLATYRAARAALLADFATRMAEAVRFSSPDELRAVLDRLSEERDAAMIRLGETQRASGVGYGLNRPRLRRRRYRHRRKLRMTLR
jgi:hypothetical protein